MGDTFFLFTTKYWQVIWKLKCPDQIDFVVLSCCYGHRRWNSQARGKTEIFKCSMCTYFSWIHIVSGIGAEPSALNHEYAKIFEK